MQYVFLTLKEMKYKLLIAVFCYLLFASIFELGLGRTYSTCEMIFIILSLLICVFLFNGQDETELLVTSRISLENIFLIRFIVTFLCITLLPCLHLYIRVQGSQPDVAAVSFLATMLFCCALGSFWSIILSSSFSALIFSFLCCTVLIFPSVAGGELFNIYKTFSPFYSIQLKGDAYIINRALVLAYVVILFSAAYFALRKRRNKI